MDAHIYSASTVIEASPEQVFACWACVDQWHLWDPDTRQATLDGPLRVGARGRLTPAKGRAVSIEIVGLEPGLRLDVIGSVLGSRLHFDHRLVPVSATSCRVTHTVRFSGWLRPFLEATVGRDVQRGLPRTMASLKRYVESAFTSGLDAADPAA